MKNENRFSEGLQIRREVVGEARVNKSLDMADDFSRPLQELTTSFAWGEVWSRSEVLDRRSKSIATLGMLIALGKFEEFKVHLLGAINNGVSVEEVREIIIHSSVYCGFPAALEATRAAQQKLAEMKSEAP